MFFAKNLAWTRGSLRLGLVFWLPGHPSNRPRSEGGETGPRREQEQLRRRECVCPSNVNSSQRSRMKTRELCSESPDRESKMSKSKVQAANWKVKWKNTGSGSIRSGECFCRFTRMQRVYLFRWTFLRYSCYQSCPIFLAEHFIIAAINPCSWWAP